MENNLDNFFKKKLGNREFDMKDAYWAEMEQMIEADEKGNDRKFLWAWLLGGLLLVMVVGGYFWNVGIGSTVTADQAITNTNVIPELEQTQKATNLLETKEANQAEAIDSNNENVNTSSNQNTVNNNNNNNNNIEVAKTDASAIKEKQPSKNTVSSDAKINSIKESTTKPYTTSSNNNVIVEKRVISETNISPTIFLQKEKEKEKEILANPTEVTPTYNKPILKQQAPPSSNQKNVKKKKEEIAKKPIASVLNIPSLDLFTQLMGDKFKTNQEESLPDLAWMNINKKKRFSLGLTAGIVSFPFGQDTIDAGNGYKIGLTARYKLKRNLALNADLMYSYRSGEYEPIQEPYEEVTYSFGRSTDRYELTPSSLHYLEMPIYLTYTKNKHVFEGGVSASYLLGVKGSTIKTTNEGPNVATEDPYWIENSGYKKILTNVALGYRFQVSPNLHFGVRGVYSLGSTIARNDPVSISGPERYELTESNPLHLTFKLTQYLF